MTRYASTQQDLFSKSAARPGTITQEEYETKWKPQGWKLLVIGPTATWRRDWGPWEAIRDIVQNCLDETEAYQYGFDSSGMWIGDKGRGVAVEDFLLGPPKMKPDYARGKFGEGMKIASLALVRLGYGVHVETVNRELWIVFLEQKVNGRVQQLAALWKPNGYRAGTRFYIMGYQGESFRERFAVNLPRTLVLAQVPAPVWQPQQRYNDLFMASGLAASHEGGRIYCRDIWLKDIHSLYSYNLWGFEVAPDRHGPLSESEMYKDMGRLWMGVKNVSLLRNLIRMISDPPLEVNGVKDYIESTELYIESFSGQNPVTKKTYAQLMMDNESLWKQAWDQVVGKDAVLATESRLEGMVKHLGYRSHGVKWTSRPALKLVIKSDADLVREMSEKLDQAQRIPDSHLTPRQLASLNLARAIAEGFSKTGPVYAAIIPPVSEMVSRTAGLYEFGSGMIKISAEMLEGAQRTVGVMVHELGHHEAYKQSGFKSKEEASDLTKPHADAMEYVAGRVFQAVAKGEYDLQLDDPDLKW